MAQKNNTKCLRLSDELIEMIEAQTGNTFTQKFENLVTRCMWELPAKEAELKRIEDMIQRRQGQLLSMGRQIREMESTINDLLPRAQALGTAIDRNIEKWDCNT